MRDEERAGLLYEATNALESHDEAKWREARLLLQHVAEDLTMATQAPNHRPGRGGPGLLTPIVQVVTIVGALVAVLAWGHSDLSRDIDRLDRKVDRLDLKIDGVEATVNDLRVDVGKIQTVLGIPIARESAPPQ